MVSKTSPKAGTEYTELTMLSGLELSCFNPSVWRQLLLTFETNPRTCVQSMACDMGLLDRSIFVIIKNVEEKAGQKRGRRMCCSIRMAWTRYARSCHKMGDICIGLHS